MNSPSLPETIETERLLLRPWRFDDVNIGMHFDRALAEMGWSIARGRWGQGLGTEAAMENGAVLQEKWDEFFQD